MGYLFIEIDLADNAHPSTWEKGIHPAMHELGFEELTQFTSNNRAVYRGPAESSVAKVQAQLAGKGLAGWTGVAAVTLPDVRFNENGVASVAASGSMGPTPVPPSEE